MPTTSIPLERLLFGNDHWSSYNAIDEMEIYSDLLDNLEDQIDSLETRGKDEEVALTNVKAVISSYAVEIAMKSLWALDNPSKRVPHTHDLIEVFSRLNDETVRSLKRLGLTTQVLAQAPTPFLTNRYSMEYRSRDITIFQTQFLRSLILLLKDKLKDKKQTPLKSP